MERGDKIELLAFLYAMAFFAGSLWDLLLPGQDILTVHETFHQVLPDDALLYFLLLPVISGLFFGLTGIPLCFFLGYENREIFSFLAGLLKEEFLLEASMQTPPGMETFLGYGAWLLAATSGSTLGACFSFLHEDPRWEMLLSTVVYVSAVAFLTGVHP